ncbi:MAG: acyl-CoA thioesterase [Bacteroidales bacterium]|nr:acyl-CoA thioesterase [Bacteroidales bacterium]
MVYYETVLPVRYYECDPMGIVHHSNYIRFFECARSAMMEAYGYSVQACADDKLVFPIAGIQLRYHHPLRMGDSVRVTAAIRKMPLAKLEVEQQVFNQDGVLCCEGTVVLGFMDADTGRVLRCPEKFSQMLQAHLSDKDEP